MVHQIVVIIGVSVLSGVLIAGLALPWIALVRQGAEESASAIDGFPLKLKFKPLNERTRVIDAHGNQITSFFDENRKYVKLDKIDDTMQNAIIAIEDDRFYEHGAIDIQGTLRALLVNSTSSGIVQGGSSITQQLVKLTRLDNARNDAQSEQASDDTFARKFEELRYAVWVEDHLTKDEILEHYLNIAYFGAGAYGIEAAAHRYFSTSADELTLPQAALLAGIVKNPSGYDPTLHPVDAKNRRDLVIDRMLTQHRITAKQAREAKKTGLKLNESTVDNGCVNTKAPWFCDYLLNYLEDDEDLGKTVEERRQLIFGGGLTIKTTLDQRVQNAATKSVADHVYPTDNAIGGLAMVEPGTGYVRALAQSRPMGPNEKKGETFLNYVVPKRYGDSNGFQPGSTFKAFVLSQAIKDKVPLNTTINAPDEYVAQLGDYRICNNQFYPSTGTYTFHNSTGSGPKNLYTGTRESVNTFFVQLELITGLCEPWRLAKSMGIELENPEVGMTPSFTLGTQDVSPLEMAEAYATFAARGLHCPSTPVLQIKDRDGNIMPLEKDDCNRVMSPPEADAVSSILEGVINGGFAAEQYLGSEYDAAGKTGTVQETKGVWFVGYTPNLAGAAMIAGANDAGTPITLIGQTIHGIGLSDASGSGTAAPMWGQVLRAGRDLGWLAPGQFIPPDASVIAGQTIPIAFVAGYNPDEAARILTEAGFHPQIVGTQVNSEYAQGTVAYTSPSGEGVSGETILIYVSNGIPEQPDRPGGGNPGGGDPGGGNPGGGNPGGGDPGGGPGNGNGNGNGHGHGNGNHGHGNGHRNGHGGL
jgi:membrane peptidoglycan carboxypeptidase